jgi:ABC-type Co2+ transport system, periplasmic component
MWKPCLAALVLVASISGPAYAHFGMVIPSKAVVEDQKNAGIDLQLSFSHPMEMVGMPLAKPAAFTVFMDGEGQDILPSLKPAKIMGHDGWKAGYTVKKPGVYQFVMQPQPYWEPAEDCFIIHYSKTVVAAFGEEEGWDEPLGLKTEILPLTRPFGNYAGNVFRGQVLLNGKPVPGAQVEVEFYNRDKKYAAPNEYMVTQVVKADSEGVFTYGVPFAGWWGFAALNTAEEKMPHEGKEKDVELGAVLWMEFVAPVLK